MFVPEDIDDPDQVPTMSDAADTSTVVASTAFKPKQPIMGGLVQTSATDYCAWTGGKPKADWTGLDPTAAKEPKDAYQYRPGSPGSAQKSLQYRETGMTKKFTRSSNLLNFVSEVKTYLIATGMDTIAYRPSPDDPNEVLFVVTDYSILTQDSTHYNEETFVSKFDSFDRSNDTSATKWLRNSVDDDLLDDLTDRLSITDSFASHWLQLIALIQSVSFA